MFNGKSILITGGTGSFGKKFIETLLQRYQPKRIVVFSRDELKQFLLQNLYRHYKVMRMAVKSRRVIHELFDAFLDEPRLLPPDHRFKDANRQARGIADYIAGMTDRYAIKEHRRIYKI